MNLENARQSNNVEIDCLGVRTRIDSPAADAAFACQAEVSRAAREIHKWFRHLEVCLYPSP